MRTFFLTLIYLSTGSFPLLAQDKIGFDVKVVHYQTNEAYDLAMVEVYCDTLLTDFELHTAETMCHFDLDTGKVYKISVSAPEQVTRFFYVDLTVPADFSKEEIEHLNGSAQVSLFEKKKEVDYSYVLTNPITTFSIDSDDRQLGFDMQEAVVMVKKVEELMK